MTLALNIYDPDTYPTRRDEDWHYSDLKRHLREDLIPVLDDTVLRRVPYEIDVKQSGIINEWGHPKETPLHDRVEYIIHEGVSLVHIIILSEDLATTSIRQLRIKLSRNAHYKQFVFSTGAGFQRFETHVDHAGEGATVALHGAYLLKDKAHFDLTTRVSHNGEDGVTDQQIRGIVKDQAMGIFQGRILVNRGADGTDAKMHHGAILLNDGAKVRAKPELEIYADDVSCAHGNTVGALDESALFFCGARGMDEVTARSLLTQAYVRPIIDLIEDEEAKAEVEAWLEQVSGGFYGL